MRSYLCSILGLIFLYSVLYYCTYTTSSANYGIRVVNVQRRAIVKITHHTHNGRGFSRTRLDACAVEPGWQFLTERRKKKKRKPKFKPRPPCLGKNKQTHRKAKTKKTKNKKKNNGLRICSFLHFLDVWKERKLLCYGWSGSEGLHWRPSSLHLYLHLLIQNCPPVSSPFQLSCYSCKVYSI